MPALRISVCVFLWLQAPAAPVERRGDRSFAGLLVQKSENVEWLEQLVRAPETVPEVSRSPVLGQQLRNIRTMAYARLGELGTPAAISALTRIATSTITAVKLTPPTLPRGVWTHPAWHMGDYEAQPLLEVDTPQGRVAFVRHRLLGRFRPVRDLEPHTG